MTVPLESAAPPASAPTSTHPDPRWWVRCAGLVVGGIGLWAVAVWTSEPDASGVVKDATPAITAALASGAWVFMLGAETVHWFFRFLGADPDTRGLRRWSWATIGLVVALGVWLLVREGTGTGAGPR
jgi:hypothetical protein